MPEITTVELFVPTMKLSNLGKNTENKMHFEENSEDFKNSNKELCHVQLVSKENPNRRKYGTLEGLTHSCRVGLKDWVQRAHRQRDSSEITLLFEATHNRRAGNYHYHTLGNAARFLDTLPSGSDGLCY